MRSGTAVKQWVARFVHRPDPPAEEVQSPYTGASTHEPWLQEIVKEVGPYTLTSPERVAATADAVDYVVRRQLPGALVECGVWRGGSILAMIRALQRRDVDDRDIYLFDTFEGMTPPTEADLSDFDVPALETWRQGQEVGVKAWDAMFNGDVFNFDAVRELLLATGYPEERIHFVVGPVEETLPHPGLDAIAVMRLDTDWYESTRHELQHLYPALVEGGVLIIDDYGHWQGARRAVDEYFDGTIAPPLLLSRIDYTGRMGVKG